MTSSLFGIYTAQRSLMLNQAAMNLINSNIANINTPGYSKQRLELSQNTVMTNESHNPYIAAQSGAGTMIDNITRNRDLYLDAYFRTENSDLFYYKELNDNSLLIEDITNELSEDGIGGVLNQFYIAASQLSTNPNDSVIRANFAQRAEDVATKFNQTSSQLEQLRTSIVGDGVNPDSLETSKVGIAVNDLNSKLTAIADLNHTICVSTAQGATPNNLLDQRDKLLDQISEYIPITVTQGHNNLVLISVNGAQLVNGDTQVGFLKANLGDVSNPAVISIQDKDGNNVVADAKSILTSGKMAGLLQLGGSEPDKMNIYNVMSELDKLAREFAREINTIQMSGKCIDNSVDPPVLKNPTYDIFVDRDGIDVADENDITAGNIMVNKDILSNAFEISAATSANLNETGDGSNALLMAKLRDKSIGNLENSTTEKYLNSIIGDLGVRSKSIYDNYESQNTIIDQVKLRRESTIGVNLDEELTDLIKFQRAFEASAKLFNVMDGVLSKIINLAQ